MVTGIPRGVEERHTSQGRNYTCADDGTYAETNTDTYFAGRSCTDGKANISTNADNVRTYSAANARAHALTDTKTNTKPYSSAKPCANVGAHAKTNATTPSRNARSYGN